MRKSNNSLYSVVTIIYEILFIFKIY